MPKCSLVEVRGQIFFFLQIDGIRLAFKVPVRTAFALCRNSADSSEAARAWPLDCRRISTHAPIVCQLGRTLFPPFIHLSLGHVTRAGAEAVERGKTLLGYV